MTIEDLGDSIELDANNLAVRIALSVEQDGGFLFHDGGEPYVHMADNGRSEITHLRNARFRSMLTHKSMRYEGLPAGKETVENAIRILEAVALFSSPEIRLHNRVAMQDGGIYFDLSDMGGRCVHITPDGWEIEKAPILFRRYKHQRPAVLPSKSERPIKERLESFLELVNYDRDTELLHLVELVFSFVPDVPHPIPVVYGQQGSAKSSFFRVWGRLVDPSDLEDAVLPRKEVEMIQKLEHHWFLAFDNVSKLWEWQSDDLCRAATGTGFSKRKLYSDDEDIIYKYKRVVGLNGINVAAERPDLLDRSILHEFPEIPLEDRMEEREIWERFERAAPDIMGAIFDALSEALRILPTVNLTGLYRMADFTRWGCAIAEAIGYSQQDFLNEYCNNINTQNTEALENNPVGTAVLSFWNSLDLIDERWRNTPTQAYQTLTKHAEGLDIKVSGKDWPKSPAAMSRELNRLKTNLKKEGILFERPREGNVRYWQLSPVEGSEYVVTVVMSSQSSAEGEIPPSNDDDTCDDISDTRECRHNVVTENGPETASPDDCDAVTTMTIKSETLGGTPEELRAFVGKDQYSVRFLIGRGFSLGTMQELHSQGRGEIVRVGSGEIHFRLTENGRQQPCEPETRSRQPLLNSAGNPDHDGQTADVDNPGISSTTPRLFEQFLDWLKAHGLDMRGKAITRQEIEAFWHGPDKQLHDWMFKALDENYIREVEPGVYCWDTRATREGVVS